MVVAKAEQKRLMVEARAEQLPRQDQLMAKIDLSRTSNEELCKANEELCRNLQQLDERSTGERGPIAQLRARPKPFSQAIMDIAIPANYITPKIVFTSVEGAPRAILQCSPPR